MDGYLRKTKRALTYWAGVDVKWISFCRFVNNGKCVTLDCAGATLNMICNDEHTKSPH